MTSPDSAIQPAGRRIKTAAGKPVSAVGARLAWADVLRVLQGDETRERCLSRYRAAEFTPDDFGCLRAAREAMADALTRTEDWLEYRELDEPKGRLDRYRQRMAIRDVRRRLERELWP
jgi:hypothetical protein